jgi:hypothetical protein
MVQAAPDAWPSRPLIPDSNRESPPIQGTVSRTIGSLSANERNKLARAIKSTLRAAIRRRSSTLDDYRGTEGQSGDYDRYFAVFSKEGRPCPKCACITCVNRIIQHGRSTYYFRLRSAKSSFHCTRGRKKSKILIVSKSRPSKETVVVNENSGRKTITKFEASVKRLALRWRHCQRLNDGPIALNFPSGG